MRCLKMNNTQLKEAADNQLIFAVKTLSMIANGEIQLMKSIKPIETAISNISDARSFFKKKAMIKRMNIR